MLKYTRVKGWSTKTNIIEWTFNKGVSTKFAIENSEAAKMAIGVLWIFENTIAGSHVIELSRVPLTLNELADTDVNVVKYWLQTTNVFRQNLNEARAQRFGAEGRNPI